MPGPQNVPKIYFQRQLSESFYDRFCHLCIMSTKNQALGSRIRDMEADMVNIFDLHTANAHFGTLTQCSVHPTVPK